PRHSLIDPRVVLHRAGAERIESKVDVIVPGREPGEMADDVDFAQFWHSVNTIAQQSVVDDFRDPASWNIQRRKIESLTAGGAFLEDEPFVDRKVIRDSFVFRFLAAHSSPLTNASI